MVQNTILLADDEDTLRKNLAQVLSEEGFEVIACKDGTEALRALRANTVDAMITDLRMPGVCGMDLIDHAKKLAPGIGIIVITAFGEVETAVEAMKKGAQDYICKPLIFDELIFRLKRLLAHDELARENKVLHEQIKRTRGSSVIVSESQSFSAILDTVARVSRTMSNVLIYGESGTGKEVLARAIHDGGLTKNKPFVAVNCGGLAENLVESELFGYRRGAFTGASTDRTGYFEAANGGTLFLDEIGNLPYRSQATLLRAVEERAITRVGENHTRPVKIRIIAATNRDLEQPIEIGEFREDLYFRLNVVRIDIPPLRERCEDIPPLIEHFAKKYSEELNCTGVGFTPEAIEAMCGQPWRGNVRELENIVERAMIFADDKQIDVQSLSFAIGTNLNTATPTPDLRASLQGFERQHILKVLSKHKENKAEAAEALGIGLSSLYRKMEELDIGKGHADPSRVK